MLWILKSVLTLVLKISYRVRVTGDFTGLNSPKCVITPNHLSFLDGLLLGLYLPVRPVFVIDTGIANRPMIRMLLRYIDHVTVDPLHPMAIKILIREVDKGRPIVIFPEGRITTTGSLMKIYEGAAFIAAKTGAALVPVRLDGAELTPFGKLSKLFKIHFFPRITLHVLKPVFLTLPDAPSARERRQQIGVQLRDIMMESRMTTRPPYTLFHAFLAAKARFGKQAPCFEDINMVEESYQSLFKKSVALAYMTHKISKKNERVGILLPNSVGLVATILGLSAQQRIPALMNYTAGQEGLLSSATAACIQTIITSRTFLEKAKLQHLPAALSHITWHYAEDLRQQINWIDKLMIGLRIACPKWFFKSTAASDEAVVLFTSGSEGKPKGVVHTHQSLISNAEQLRTIADFTPNDRFMICLPMFHAFGLTTGFTLPLLSGARAFLYPSPLHYRVIPELVYDKGCNVLFGTSTFLQHYARYAAPYDFAKLRYVVAGAEKLSESVKQIWQDKFGLRVLEGYGVTECAPVISINTPMAAKTGSVGKLLPLMQARLIPIAGIEQGGRLEVSGPNIMKGYLKFDNPGVIEAPDCVDNIVWYDTGDIVEIDAQGFVFIKGRAKRFAKIAGEMVSLEVVEAIAKHAYPDAQHAASLRPDAQKGEALVLFSTSALERSKLLESARLLGASELALAKDIRVLSRLPLLGSGKPDYLALKSMAEQGEP